MEYGKVFLTNVEKRKAVVKQQFESKQRLLLVKLKLREERIQNFKKQRKNEQIVKIAKNKEKLDKTRLRIIELKDLAFYRTLELRNKRKNKDRKTVENIVNFKRSTLATKQVKELNQYWAKYENQIRTTEINRSMIERCVENIQLVEKAEVIVEIGSNVNEGIETETESSDNCAYNPKAKSMNMNLTFIQRIENLRINSTKCVQDAAFWNKTAPLWNKMTMCLQANIAEASMASESELSVPKEYAEEKARRYLFDLTDDTRPPSLMQQIMMNDVDYNLSDETMFEMIAKAKSLSEPGASAFDIINLIRRVTEYEADVRNNVNYFVISLAERAVFELTKKKIAEKIFVDMRKTIDRLQHVNDRDIIPTKLIKSKKMIEVTSFIFEMISNDEVYSRFDMPLDDEPRYVAQISETAEDRFKNFQWENYPDTKMSTIRFPIKGREELNEKVDNLVRLFLEHAHQKTAQFVSTSKVNEYEERVKAVLPSSGPAKGQLTLHLVYRICRKISKLVFGMFATEEKVMHNFEMTVDAYVLLVANRTSRVNYNTKVYKRRKSVDVDDFNKLYDETLKSIRNEYCMV
ncbi:uncharacterized protein LOC100572868 [Acyrthosiphon pisum]|uniref:Uncharacterized protein n=1 Tax=Acyrthosiphon pisum TaxID=7029 RepID=A0A8R1W9A5_ACYPI|nr:uncharacterized protein LOC100572868 [Acyrthosiphon pisum]|eukprot:XP_003246494.1 PREDICTED: uncharacterized protein LOC100572868 [Acyrthosiphon pisum]